MLGRLLYTVVCLTIWRLARWSWRFCHCGSHYAWLCEPINAKHRNPEQQGLRFRSQDRVASGSNGCSEKRQDGKVKIMIAFIGLLDCWQLYYSAFRWRYFLNRKNIINSVWCGVEVDVTGGQTSTFRSPFFPITPEMLQASILCFFVFWRWLQQKRLIGLAIFGGANSRNLRLLMLMLSTGKGDDGHDTNLVMTLIVLAPFAGQHFAGPVWPRERSYGSHRGGDSWSGASHFFLVNRVT